MLFLVAIATTHRGSHDLAFSVALVMCSWFYMGL